VSCSQEPHFSAANAVGLLAPGNTVIEMLKFIENGQHNEGNPSKKDFFVPDNVDTYTNGILMFAAASGLQVHYNLRQNEFPWDRVMNRNHLAGPHK
jgi:hypothetical protein